MRNLPTFLPLFLACACSAGDPIEVIDPQAAATLVQNLGLSTAEVEVGDGFVAFTVSEEGQGFVDLNNDGDTQDRVLFVQQYSRNDPVNLGWAVDEVVTHRDYIAFVVVEDAHVGDLNEDGDQEDRVLLVHQVSTKETTRLKLATSTEVPNTNQDVVPAYLIKFNEDCLAFMVTEFGQGQTDFTGDGDVFDGVLAFHDLTLGTTTLTSLPLTYFRDWVAPGVFIGSYTEFDEDLNGDGLLGHIPIRFDFVGGALTSNPLPLNIRGPIRSGDGFAMLLVPEFWEGDVNQDGDTNDDIAFAYDIVSDRIVNTREEIEGLIIFEGPFAGFRGQARELVMYDSATERTVRTGIHDALLESTGIGYLHYVLREHDFGDLNQDGDSDDFVSYLWDFERARSLILGAGILRMGSINDRSLIFTVLEEQAGDIDGDGDSEDDLIFVFDPRTGQLTRQRAGGLYVGTLDQALYVTATVLKEDSHEGEVPPFTNLIASTSGGTPKGLEISGRVIDSFTTAFEGAFPLLVREVDQNGGSDLNGDGDQADFVLHLVRRGLPIPVN